MNAVLGRMASTAQELAHYHSGDGITFPSSLNIFRKNYVIDFEVHCLSITLRFLTINNKVPILRKRNFVLTALKVYYFPK